MRRIVVSFLGLTLLFGAATIGAAPIKIKGVLNNNRYDDGDQLKSEYLGYENGKAYYIVDFGIYALTWDGNELSTPVKEPAVVKSEIMASEEKKTWAANFNLMYGNSGAVHVGDKLVTVMSRDYQSTEDHELFAIRKWDANTGDLLNARDEYMHVDSNLESAGMSYNPKDGKVYGFFHITNAKLMDDVLNDPDYTPDQDDVDFGREGLDDGYCLGTIDLRTMKITPITPGLYYGNYVAFAINSEGRAFVLTSGGANGFIDDDGKMYNLDNELTGAQLIEIDTKTGLMKRNAKKVTDPDTGEVYYEYSYPLPASGYCSQVHRQAACFSKSDPSKLYWIGFYNSGKGVNSWGSWSTLDQREWRTNGLYDTALYVMDVNTGECTRLAKVPTRASYSCIWIEGDDPSADAGDVLSDSYQPSEPEEDPKEDNNDPSDPDPSDPDPADPDPSNPDPADPDPSDPDPSNPDPSDPDPSDPDPSNPDPDKPDDGNLGVYEIMDQNGEVTFYDLQGHKVANPKPGLYIVKSGNIVRKIVIR